MHNLPPASEQSQEGLESEELEEVTLDGGAGHILEATP